MPRVNRYPRFGWFAPNGRFVASGEFPRAHVIKTWKEPDIELRPVVYMRGLTRLCAGCRGRRNRTKFDVKPASRKERLIRCDKCNREISRNDAANAAASSTSGDSKKVVSTGVSDAGQNGTG